MLILSIEQSTQQGSLAILQGTTVIADRVWTDTRFHSRHLFVVLADALTEAALAVRDVDVFVVGLGPGSYTGLRMAVSAASSMALPDGKPVFGLSSAEALAAATFASLPKSTPVLVVGDARRDSLWMGLFNPEDSIATQPTEWKLGPISDVPDVLREGGVIVTPDWTKLGSLLHNVCSGRQNLCLIEETRFPSATALAGLAARRLTAGMPSLPLLPIYLHPPAATRTSRSKESTHT